MVAESERASNRTRLSNARRPFRRAVRWFQERDDLFRDLTNLIIAVATVYVAFRANTIAQNQSALMETQNALLQREQLPLFDIALVTDDGESSTNVVVYNTRGLVSRVQVRTSVAIPVCLSTPAISTPAATPDEPALADLDTCQMLVLTDAFKPASYDRSNNGEIARAATASPLGDLQFAIATVRTDLASRAVQGSESLTLLDAVVVVDLDYLDAAGRPQTTTFQIVTDGSERIVELPASNEERDPMTSATSRSTNIGVTTDSAGNPRQFILHRLTTSEFTAEEIRRWWSSEVAPIVR